MSSAATWQIVAPQPNELGESPFWHPHEQTLYWLDIPGRNILRTNVFMGTVESWPMPSEPGCMAPAASGGLVIALRDGIYRARDWGGALELIQKFDHNPATTRFNDGKADTLGRFWAGTIFEPRTSPEAGLFSIDCRDGGSPLVQRQAGDATTANGLAWSPDNKTVYWADTPRHLIRSWDWSAQTNAMSAERVFKQFPLKPADWRYGATDAGLYAGRPDVENYGGRPDGAAVDIQGNYYVAMFEGQRVLKLSPSGELLATLHLPAQCPTMPCFGGADLQTLYVTSARHNRSPQELADFPHSGCVFSTRVDVPGLPVNFFQD